MNRLFLVGGSLVSVIMGLLSLISVIAVEATPNDTGPLINEFVFDIDGSDTHEFVEIWGDPNTDYSGYFVLIVEGDYSSSGAGQQRGNIDRVYEIGTTNAEGYWTTGYLSGQIENGTLTVLLVQNFTGQTGDDLDADNDGVLDVDPPWDAVIDDVAVHDNGSNDWVYGTVTLTGDIDTYYSDKPGGASRIEDHVDTDSENDWKRNDYEGEGLPGFFRETRRRRSIEYIWRGKSKNNGSKFSYQ